jgi:hypothetical protein
MQKLITKEIDAQLRANGQLALDGKDTSNTKPVLKLFNPCGAATWLISERDPEEPDLLFGLCDLGFGCPEIGRVSLAEIEALRLPFGLRIERDIHFKATKTLIEYADEARAKGSIAA